VGTATSARASQGLARWHIIGETAYGENGVRRQIPLLRGLSILAVVCNHAAGWGFIAMFWWTNLYRQVDTVPNYDQLGSLPYYGLVAVQQLALFSVPAFLFISGFFIAYAARGNAATSGSSSTLSWKFVRTQIARLLWPYVVWSLVIFITDALQGTWYSPLEYVRRLVVGEATDAYFFVPLLCQFYLLSPLIARWGKRIGGWLIAIAVVIQLVVTGLLYLPFLGVSLPDWVHSRGELFVWHAIYFPLGTVCGFHYSRLKPWLARAKCGLLVATVVLGVLSILESEALYRETLNYGWARGGFKFSTILYAIAFILFLLTLSKPAIPFKQAINQIGTKSYGVYLLHPKVLELVARVIYHVAPWMLAHQILYQPVLVATGAGIPLLFMNWMMKSRAKKFSHYLFG
jgi:peptidoglycan/LPS O-acetylase OafA/YrhL